MKPSLKLPLNNLRAFEVAARHTSFLRAAEELNVTAGAISHRIRDLEQALGLELFRRHAQGVELTDAGRQYYRDIARALLDIQRATDALDTRHIEGPLTVSVSNSLAQYWLAPRLGALSARHPGIELTLLLSDCLTDLHTQQADVGIRFGMGDYPSLHADLLMHDAASVLLPVGWMQANQQSSLAELLKNSVLLDDHAIQTEEPWMGWTPWLRELDVHYDEPGPRTIRFSSAAASIAACQGNAGAVIGRASLVLDLLQRKQLEAVTPWRRTEFSHHVVVRAAERDNPRIQAFRNWLHSEAQDFITQVEDYLPVQLTLGKRSSMQ